MNWGWYAHGVRCLITKIVDIMRDCETDARRQLAPIISTVDSH